MRLNLGSGDRLLPKSEGWINADLAEGLPPNPGPKYECEVAHLDIRWPWGDCSAEEIAAFDIFEHLPDRIHTMNELWRVLKPGARAVVEVPNAARGAGFWQDPTHVTGWCLNSFQYFEQGSFAHQRLSKAYGIKGAFRIVSLTEREYRDVREAVWKITAVLEAVK